MDSDFNRQVLHFNNSIKSNKYFSVFKFSFKYFQRIEFFKFDYQQLLYIQVVNKVIDENL